MMRGVLGDAASAPNVPTDGIKRYPPYPYLATRLMLGRTALVVAIMAAVWYFTARQVDRDEACN
jgi:hypothetical protein